MGKIKNNTFLYAGAAVAGIATVVLLSKIPKSSGEKQCPVGQQWNTDLGICESVCGPGEVWDDASKSCKVPVQPPASIQLNASKLNVEPGEEVVCTATVLNASGNPVSGVSIYLFVNNSLEGSGGVTNSSGKAQFAIDFANEGTYGVHVSDRQDGL